MSDRPIENSIRKIRKPLMEKKRRARINDSLEALKEILLKNTVAITQGSRPTKLEKADILEMTVRYLNVLHKQLVPSAAPKADCAVSSTTAVNAVKPTLFGAGNPYSMANVNGQFRKIVLPKKRERQADKENCVRSLNPIRVGGSKQKLKYSENSAFRVISRSRRTDNTKGKSKTAIAMETDDPWRPW